MSRDACSTYLLELRRYKVLDREEEHTLALEYRATGDPEVARRLAEGHLRLVVSIAKRYAWNRQDLADLVEQGNVGLLLAIRKYDPDRGVRLSSYATFWIRALIMQQAVAGRRLVRIGTTIKQRRVMFQLGRELQKGELDLAERLGISEEDLATLAIHMRSRSVLSSDHCQARTGAPAGTSLKRLLTISAAGMVTRPTL